MAYKIYQKLKSGMAALGLIDSTDIDDLALGKKQSELNNLFNQGKNSVGEQVGKTYSDGDGISISQQDVISVKVGNGLEINQTSKNVEVKAATALEIGGVKSTMAQSYQGGQTNLSLTINNDGTAKVVVPTATDSQIGLMSAEDHQRLNTHAFTVDFGSSQDSVTVMHMDAACTLVRVATQNVSSVTISVVNGGTVTPTLVSGAATISLSCPTETGIVIDIVRTAAGDASVGIKYELS